MLPVGTMREAHATGQRVAAPMIAGYDVIGDVHGHAEKLEGLLARLGYVATKGAWRHPDRQVQ